MRENYTLPRLYLDVPLTGGAQIDLPKDQAHYLATVIRKSAGDHVRAFNGRDGEWQAEIISASKRAVTLSVGEQLRLPASCPDITLAFALVRKHRTAFIIEKATELGVRTLQPLITARTQFPKINLDKARAQAIEAAEQTERLDIPAILPVAKLSQDWLKSESDYSLIFADEAGGVPAVTALAGMTGPATILIGPEGGFTDIERDMILAKPNVTRLSLGPRILRADTAAVSLLTLYQAMNGDWSDSNL